MDPFFCQQIVDIGVWFVSEPNLKLKLRVQLVNQAGAEEAGIDGGGLFREFISELLKWVATQPKNIWLLKIK